MNYLLGEKSDGDVPLDHLANLRGTKLSADRSYARFGAYQQTTLK